MLNFCYLSFTLFRVAELMIDLHLKHQFFFSSICFFRFKVQGESYLPYTMLMPYPCCLQNLMRNSKRMNKWSVSVYIRDVIVDLTAQRVATSSSVIEKPLRTAKGIFTSILSLKIDISTLSPFQWNNIALYISLPVTAGHWLCIVVVFTCNCSSLQQQSRTKIY